MSAYNRGELSIEAYLVRIIAAACRQVGGELRIKGELIDTIGEATALMKSWDTKTQELVLSVSMGSFSEVFRVTPEKQNNQKTFVFDPNAREQNETPKPPATHGNTLDNPNLDKIEKDLQKRRIAAMMREEMKRRNQGEPA